MKRSSTHRHSGVPVGRHLRLFVLLCTTWIALPVPTYGQAPDTGDPAGSWRGQIEIPGSPLGVIVELTRTGQDGWAGTIEIPAQGDDALDLTDIRVAGDSVVFSIVGVPGEPTFRGTIAPDGSSIEGTFTQGPQNFPFALARPGAADLSEELAGVDGWITEQMAAWRVPGLALAVVQNGEVAHLAGYGLRSVADSLPVTPRTLFAIGSSTKAFTTSLLGTYVDDGTLRWDDPVNSYLPELALADTAAAHQLTIRDLVTHRSGLPRHDAIWYANPGLERADFMARMAHLAPTQPLRAAWQYNNLAFIMAGHLMERLEGERWETLTRLRLLEPLGMTRSNFSVAESQADPDHALPYAERGDSTVRMEFRALDAVGPAGSINSTVEEMARWVRLHLAGGTLDGNTVLELGTVRELQTPAMAIAARPDDPALGIQSYALGWFTDSYRGHFRVHHGGNIDGFSAMVSLFPHDDLGIVVLTNMNATPMAEFTARHVADRALGLEPRDWSGEARAGRDAARARSDSLALVGEEDTTDGEPVVEGTTPSHQLAGYAGTYRHPGYGDFGVEVAPGEAGLRVRYYDLELDLEHVHYDIFVTRDPEETNPFAGIRIRFTTGFDGSIEAVDVPIEPTLPATTFLRAPDDRLTNPTFLERLTGPYRREGETVQISRRGNQLVVAIPGQPSYVLVADRETTFTLEAAPQVRLTFEVPGEGSAEAVTFHQPNGSFRYERPDG